MSNSVENVELEKLTKYTNQLKYSQSNILYSIGNNIFKT